MWRGKKINKKSSDEEDMEGAMLGEEMERLKDFGYRRGGRALVQGSAENGICSNWRVTRFMDGRALMHCTFGGQYRQYFVVNYILCLWLSCVCVRETESQRMIDGYPYLQRKSDNYSERTF